MVQQQHFRVSGHCSRTQVLGKCVELKAAACAAAAAHELSVYNRACSKADYTAASGRAAASLSDLVSYAERAGVLAALLSRYGMSRDGLLAWGQRSNGGGAGGVGHQESQSPQAFTSALLPEDEDLFGEDSGSDSGDGVSHHAVNHDSNARREEEAVCAADSLDGGTADVAGPSCTHGAGNVEVVGEMRGQAAGSACEGQPQRNDTSMRHADDAGNPNNLQSVAELQTNAAAADAAANASGLESVAAVTQPVTTAAASPASPEWQTLSPGTGTGAVSDVEDGDADTSSHKPVGTPSAGAGVDTKSVCQLPGSRILESQDRPAKRARQAEGSTGHWQVQGASSGQGGAAPQATAGGKRDAAGEPGGGGGGSSSHGSANAQRSRSEAAGNVKGKAPTGGGVAAQVGRLGSL